MNSVLCKRRRVAGAMRFQFSLIVFVGAVQNQLDGGKTGMIPTFGKGKYTHNCGI
jgi:hypothetical protein